VTLRGSLQCAVALTLVLAGGRARAEPSSAGAAVDDAVTSYFAGEYAEGFAWMAVGDASLVGGGTLVAQQNGVMRGMSYPLLAFGAIQFVAGFSSLARSEARAAALRRDAAVDAAAVHRRETRRITRLNVLFRAIRYTEFSLLGLGAAGAIAGGVARQDQVLGAGIGLAVEAALMLTLDHFAEARAHRYADALRAIRVSVAPRAEGSALSLAFTGRF
jgi:hypothetical protein